MAYARPLGHTFNQLNLHMYRLPDGQRGALRSTSLALAREASREDDRSRGRRDSAGSSYNPFKGIKRLYADLRKHHSRARDQPSDGGARLRKFNSVPVTGSSAVLGSSPPPPQAMADKRKSVLVAHYASDGEVSDSALLSDSSDSPVRPARRVRFSRSDPVVRETYSPEEYDRRVNDPWESMTKEKRDGIRVEMSDYTTREMVLNNVYNTNLSEYCTLCWRERCHCRALSKDIWRRARSSSMVHAAA
ncbi:hypothetical protein LPJ61_004635 [Coemansia biformis]|uniref:Uncharacterized protein n=1 Tax=Coemansia biformis TaxID=1286918 RepID=A0A9W7Y943_9FUNG|nr:hypothetical protein LPJ61_004635 [Coemansia biformis]